MAKLRMAIRARCGKYKFNLNLSPDFYEIQKVLTIQNIYSCQKRTLRTAKSYPNIYRVQDILKNINR